MCLAPITLSTKSGHVQACRLVHGLYMANLTKCFDMGHLKFQIKRTTNNVLLANQQRPCQHCPQVKSHLSGSSSSPGHSQLMAEPSNSGGIQAPENTKGQRSRLAPPSNKRTPGGMGGAQGGAQAMERPRGGHGAAQRRPWSGPEAAMERPRGGHGAATERPRGGHGSGGRPTK